MKHEPQEAPSQEQGEAASDELIEFGSGCASKDTKGGGGFRLFDGGNGYYF